MVAEIAAGTNNLIYDLNSDALVDRDDLTTWLAVAGTANLPSHNPYLFGDADLSGFVDGQDFIIWNSHKFTPLAAWCSGDFNADGFVDGSDFVLWNSNKFTGSARNAAYLFARPLAEDVGSSLNSQHAIVDSSQAAEFARLIESPPSTMAVERYFGQLSSTRRGHVKPNPLRVLLSLDTLTDDSGHVLQKLEQSVNGK